MKTASVTLACFAAAVRAARFSPSDFHETMDDVQFDVDSEDVMIKPTLAQRIGGNNLVQVHKDDASMSFAQTKPSGP